MAPKEKNHSKKDKGSKSKSYIADDQNYGRFSMQLSNIGLEIRDIKGDGNCLFRALSDQIEGNEHQHLTYRKLVCQYMKRNQEDFEPFLSAIVDEEDNIPNKKNISMFDRYIRNMEIPGTYADNCCLVAFSRLYQFDLNIHQLDLPIWSIIGTNDVKKGKNLRQLHLAYHNGEHYSSIRQIGDKTKSPSEINLGSVKIDSNKSIKSNHMGGAAAKYYHETDSDDTHDNYSETIDRDVERIMNVTNSNDLTLITDKLTSNNNDVERTIIDILDSSKLDNESKANGMKKGKKPSKSEKKRDKKTRQMERQRLKFLEENNKSPEENLPRNDAINYKIPDSLVI